MDNSKNNSTSLSSVEARTYALSLLGYPQAEIGRLEGITDRQVRYRLAKARRVTGLQNLWSGAVLDVFKLIPKATRVMERYLDGDGRQDGGDLKAAIRILESAQVFKSKKEPVMKVEQRTTVNTAPRDTDLATMSREEMEAEAEATARRILNYLRKKKKENTDKVD